MGGSGDGVAVGCLVRVAACVGIKVCADVVVNVTDGVAVGESLLVDTRVGVDTTVNILACVGVSATTTVGTGIVRQAVTRQTTTNPSHPRNKTAKLLLLNPAFILFIMKILSILSCLLFFPRTPTGKHPHASPTRPLPANDPTRRALRQRCSAAAQTPVNRIPYRYAFV